MSNHPVVTVFIPAYNREQYISTVINSILNQQYRHFEILVVDDGSTDCTPELVSDFGDARIRLVRQEDNLGIPFARNRGLELARGRYIALLDSDDYAYPQRLARQVAYLDANPGIAQVGSWCSLMNAHGKMLKRIRRQPLTPGDIETHLLFHCSLINRTIMARTDVLREYGYDNDFPRCQDYELHGRLAEHHRMANLPEVLVCGREHGDRITQLTPGLGKNRKMAIQSRLLEILGVDFTEQDLERHYLLTQPRRGGDKLGKDYLEWAEDWLEALLRANRHHKRYEPGSMARTVGAIWALACWRHCAPSPIQLPLTLMRSRLSRFIPRNFKLDWLLAIAKTRASSPRLANEAPIAVL